MARQIQETPWSKKLEDDIYNNIIPNKVKKALDRAKENCDEWMKNKRLDPAIPASLGTMATLMVATTPMAPVSFLFAAATFGLTLRNWYANRKPPVGNGLHYFVNLKN